MVHGETHKNGKVLFGTGAGNITLKIGQLKPLLAQGNLIPVNICSHTDHVFADVATGNFPLQPKRGYKDLHRDRLVRRPDTHLDLGDALTMDCLPPL